MSMAERKTMTRAVKNPVKRKLTRAEKKEIAAVIQAAKGDGKPRTAQQTIPYLQMYPDGICRVTEKKYSKSLVFEDINYQLAQADDKTAIFENWCDFLNYFDASVSVQLSFINQGTQREQAEKAITIPAQEDAFKKLGMLIVQDQTWNRVTINRAEKKSTRYYMDEFHLLLKEEQTAAYSVEIWKRFRKWGGIPTAITQNVKDLLASREVENIFENSDFVLMLNQAQGDRTILAKQLNISPQQMKYVTHTEAGEGLIFYGNVVLPFVDRFPKDTELYRVMTTKPEEVSESGK